MAGEARGRERVCPLNSAAWFAALKGPDRATSAVAQLADGSVDRACHVGHPPAARHYWELNGGDDGRARSPGPVRRRFEPRNPASPADYGRGGRLLVVAVVDDRYQQLRWSKLSNPLPSRSFEG